MKHLILSCSLSPTSRSALLARRLESAFGSDHGSVRLIDLRELPLPFCEANACYADPNVQMVTTAIAEAATVSVATPIYNYGVGGATRNLIALTGQAWTEKVVGFLCAAGGQGSYMAVMAVANSLMLDFRCLIVPRFVYASGASFSEDRITDATIKERIDGLANDLRRIGSALARVGPQ
ncbi:MAG: NAD(P)H-dependent oxidoreductase [Planctomycetes bacterium]|nr:NAD(P)H-dependent oxidoreductase [Planctomycetota bacterium]